MEKNEKCGYDSGMAAYCVALDSSAVPQVMVLIKTLGYGYRSRQLMDSPLYSYYFSTK